jgi:C-terminal processing protease CtpA/Prc
MCPAVAFRETNEVGTHYRAASTRLRQLQKQIRIQRGGREMKPEPSSSGRLGRPFFRTAVLIALLSVISQATIAPQSNFTRAHAEIILNVIKDDIKKNYYDPEFHGIDLDARFKTADEKLKTATSVGQMFGIIAQVLVDFNDSHLYFLPPGRASKITQGWNMQAVGNNVYVSAIKPGSDAEAKGLTPGDRVISAGGFQPTRENLWVLNYMFKVLRPQPGLRLIVESPDGKQRQLDVMAKVIPGKQVMDLTSSIDANDYLREIEDEDRADRSRYAELGNELLIWKLPTFAIDPSAIDPMIGRAKRFKTVILDLRGNGGGYVETCERLVGAMFDKEFSIAEPKGRKESKPMKSKRRGDPFTGNLIVLIDSRSASASEIFARVIQIEKRGTIIGDRSAGAVMRARAFSHQLGVDTIIPYDVSVTDADVIMSDGKSLERVGVIPNELVLPTQADLAAKRDPVLSRAAALAGVMLDPEKAGALFPVEWRK